MFRHLLNAYFMLIIAASAARTTSSSENVPDCLSCTLLAAVCNLNCNNGVCKNVTGGPLDLSTSAMHQIYSITVHHTKFWTYQCILFNRVSCSCVVPFFEQTVQTTGGDKLARF